MSARPAGLGDAGHSTGQFVRMRRSWTWLWESRPDIRTTLIPDTGHFAPLTMLEQINAVLGQLIAERFKLTQVRLRN